MTVILYLDSRGAAENGKDYPVCLRITAQGGWRSVPTGSRLSIKQWDAEKHCARPSCPGARAINDHLRMMYTVAENVVAGCEIRRIYDVTEVTRAVRTALGLPDVVRSRYNAGRKVVASILKAFDKFLETKRGGNRCNYITTRRRIAVFIEEYGKPNLDDINKAWLDAFDAHLMRTAPSPNTRAGYMRCLRTVINYAIDMEWTQTYAFRRFHIKTVPTRHRALELEDLRRLLTMEVEPTVKPYRDFFFLSFLLIGINPVDMLALPPDAVKRGRIEYRRSKTAKLYDIKVEPEAQQLIDEYIGEVRLWGHADNYDNYKNYNKRVNEHLAMVGEWSIGKRGKKTFRSDFEGVTLYWARHTWATIAASLDIPKETIAQALGHSSNSVTDVYIKFDRRKVDEANRRVIDWVLYGKK